MNKITFLLLLCLQACSKVVAQGEQNIWTFGDKKGINFNTASPTVYLNNLYPSDGGSASICNAAGQMLFYTNGYWVWNRDHELMPEVTGGVTGLTSISLSMGYPLMPNTNNYPCQPVAITGMPGSPEKYYIFCVNTYGQLYYSVVDMSLHGGKGGIVPGKKGVFLAAGHMEKLTVVKGCNNIWVMTRAVAANQYRAYEINDTGIATTPVVSNVGNLPLAWYRYGVIKFSADALKMAASCSIDFGPKGGLELYDFNPQTGQLSNTVTLDSSSTLGYYYGACFSPDNSKLYAVTSSFGYAGTIYTGKVRQFNLSLPNAAAIIASNTVVFSSPYYWTNLLGDLKRSPNGKIYFGDGETRMNCIDNPNAAGVACNVVSNVLQFTGGGSTQRGVPNDIVIIPPPDSAFMHKTAIVCFKDIALLTADSGKRYQWDNGSTSRQRVISSEGTYVVRYINLECKYQTDSIHVHFTKLPVLSASGYSCPGADQGTVWIKPQTSDNTNFQYTWRNGSSSILQQHSGQQGDTLRNIDTGTYSVQITTSTGCDTTLHVSIIALPVPKASFTVDSIACKGISVVFEDTGTSPIRKWYFGDGNFSIQQSPSYGYGQTGSYTATLIVTNIEGCSDTAFREIDVKGLDLTLTADKNLTNKGDIVRLQSTGSEPYTVLAWEPAFLFPDQAATNQSVAMDTTRRFIVSAVSAYGCKAKASVEVAVNPVILVPNVFSPNGDGLNDRFFPMSSGYIFIRYFEVYNRYGQQVYNAFGQSALEGWDGTFKGQLQDMGTYYYYMGIETKEGGTIAMKGDVILMH